MARMVSHGGHCSTEIRARLRCIMGGERDALRGKVRDMYKSFRVKNFRCFKDLQINDLGRVNLIAGKNNTGKTALLEAMHILAGERGSKTLIRENLRTVYRMSWDSEQHDAALNASDIVSWSTMFRNLNTELAIELDATLDRPLLPLFADNTTMASKMRLIPRDSVDYIDVVGSFFFNDIAAVAQPNLLEITSLHMDKTEHQLLVGNRITGLTGVSKKAIETEFVSAGEKQRDRINAKRFSELRRSAGASSLCEVLQVLEPRINGLELEYDGYRTLIFADVGLDRTLPVSSLGEGIQRVASITLALNDRSTRMVFIDEIENGIHYSVQRKVWEAIGRMARELDIQVFATTHSYEMIEAAHEAFIVDNPYDMRFHRLNRRSDTGEIEAVTYNKSG